MADIGLGEDIQNVLPAPPRSFETFPTPAELVGVPLRVAGIRYVQRELGVSPVQVQEFQRALNERAVDVLSTILIALMNQWELIHGLPLRWPSEHVDAMTLDALAAYMPALTAALGVGTQTPAADASDNDRPTPGVAEVVATSPRRRTRPSTGAPSPTGSVTSTDGVQVTSPN